MSYPIRWYYLLSSWIFLASVFYPFHKVSTFPLNIIASVGIFEILVKPYKEHWLKNLYILFIHIAPFFWIPWDLSHKTLLFSLVFIAAYIVFMYIIDRNIFDSYSLLHEEKHTDLSQFIKERFGI